MSHYRRSIASLLTAALLIATTGCGGKKPPPPPKGVDKDVPTVDIDGGDDPAPSDSTPDPEPKPDAPAEPTPEPKTPEPAPKTPAEPKAPANDGAAAGDKPDAGFGHLVFHFKADKHVLRPAQSAAADPKCGVPEVPDESVVIDAKTLALANIVCWLNEDEVKLHPDHKAAIQKPVAVDNKECRFAPHITTVTVGQKLILGNKDETGHNTKLDPFDNKPINPLIPPGGSEEYTFTVPELTPVGVSCNLHRWMKGYVLAKAHPLVGVSQADGTLTIKNIPAGEHEFRFWHESGYVKAPTVDGKPAKWSKGKVKLTIPDQGTLKHEIVVAADSLM